MALAAGSSPVAGMQIWRRIQPTGSVAWWIAGWRHLPAGWDKLPCPLVPAVHVVCRKKEVEEAEEAEQAEQAEEEDMEEDMEVDTPEKEALEEDIKRGNLAIAVARLALADEACFLLVVCLFVSVYLFVCLLVLCLFACLLVCLRGQAARAGSSSSCLRGAAAARAGSSS